MRTLLFFCWYAVAGLSLAQSSPCEYDPSRKNDNYCDCPLTSEDEPQTSACSPVGVFSCPKGITIPASRVDDGVCDCCDGSDESGVKCDNTCDDLDRLVRQASEEKRRIREQGEIKFFELLEKVKQSSCSSTVLSLNGSENAEDNNLTTELSQVEEKVNELEQDADASIVVKRIESLKLNSISRAGLERLLVKLADESKNGVTLERLVAEVLPCSNSNNKDMEDTYAAEKEENEEEDSEEDREEEATCDPVWMDGEDSDELQQARKTLDDLKAKINKINEEKDDTNDYGPANIWKSLKNECLTLQKEKYKYELCLFGTFTQDHVRLGRWHGWAAPYGEMLYDSGDMCYSPAVARSVRVQIECGDNSELLDVYEPSTCVYHAKLRSPAACVPADLDANRVMCSSMNPPVS